MAWWEYDELKSGEPYDWAGSHRGDNPYDNHDFHVDLGCGRRKKGRLGIDYKFSQGVDLLIDLEELGPPGDQDANPAAEAVMTRTYETFEAEAERRAAELGMARSSVVPFGFLPFPDNSIKSVISHHTLEHIGPGFMRVMDEVHRVLEPGALFRIIVPAFPSGSAVGEPTHVRYFVESTWMSFASPDGRSCYTDAFAEPYGSARFILEHLDQSPYPMVPGTPIVDVQKLWGPEGAREFRVAYRKHKE